MAAEPSSINFVNILLSVNTASIIYMLQDYVRHRVTLMEKLDQRYAQKENCGQLRESCRERNGIEFEHIREGMRTLEKKQDRVIELLEARK